MNKNILKLRILVGLISHNRLSFTLLALERLQKTQVPFDLLIVDNGSEIETKRLLSEKALQMGAYFVSIENRNCNGARDIINHYGLEYDYVLYVDNDTIMPDLWLEQLMKYATETHAALLGISQSEFGSKDTFFGNIGVRKQFVLFEDLDIKPTQAVKVDWVTGHCLTVRGDFLRTIWNKYRLWERHLMFPIDLDDMDLMMMAKELNESVYLAPVVIPQNRNFESLKESNTYNSARNDFHNYALSCVSFWEQWNLNPLLNWNTGYTGNSNKPGTIHDSELSKKFEKLVQMTKAADLEIYNQFAKKLRLQ